MLTILCQCLTLITMVNAFHLSLLSALNPNHLSPDMKYSILIGCVLNYYVQFLERDWCKKNYK